jgi:glycosyltransferase involved in cell wall biosynthesis
MLRIAILTTDGRALSSQWAKEPVPSFGTAPSALLEGLAELPDLEVHVLSAAKDHSLIGLQLAPNIRWHPVKIGKYHQMRSLYAGSVLATRRALTTLSPDIVHGQGTEKECAMSAVHSGYPNVVTIHGNMAELQRLGYHDNRLFGGIASKLEGYTLARTAGVFCNSAYTETLVRPRSGRTWLVPNPIRKAFFRPFPEIRKTGELPRLLNVGLVSPRKRQLELLRMAGKLHKEGLAFRLVFAGGIGGGDYGKAFTDELRKAEQAGYAEYAGYLDVDTLIRLMDEMEGFIHFPTEEAFGLVVAESLARGMKFFGADLGGIRDIAEGVSGAELLATFDDLHAAIADWLRRGAPVFPEAADKMKKLYSPEVVARHHVDIYREVLSV